nr:CoA transferase [Dechloromonas sp.]
MGAMSGFRFVEIAGLGPAPFCGMMLADMGAEVIQIRRRTTGEAPLIDPAYDILNRGRIPLTLDLKSPADVAVVHELIGRADGLIEGFRPGVMERLGLGPAVCLERNPGLIYGRITGWGQDGPLAERVGHDINYLGLSGALSAIGRRDTGPVPPLNMVADFGGGGMLLVVGILAALLEKQRSGRGQVVDAAMVDGCALQLSLIYSLKNMGAWCATRGSNMLDGGAPFYDTYRCADGEYLAVGAIEAPFYKALLAVCGIDDAIMQRQWDRSCWPQQKAILAEVFLRYSRDEWVERFAGIDACVSPVLGLDEAPEDAHNRARRTYVQGDEGMQPAAAPRFSRTPSALESGSEDIVATLRRWGVSPALGERFGALTTVES